MRTSGSRQVLPLAVAAALLFAAGPARAIDWAGVQGKDNDPGMGIVRHADAGYEKAMENAKQHGIRIPGLTE